MKIIITEDDGTALAEADVDGMTVDQDRRLVVIEAKVVPSWRSVQDGGGASAKDATGRLMASLLKTGHASVGFAKPEPPFRPMVNIENMYTANSG